MKFKLGQIVRIRKIKNPIFNQYENRIGKVMDYIPGGLYLVSFKNNLSPNRFYDFELKKAGTFSSFFEKLRAEKNG